MFELKTGVADENQNIMYVRNVSGAAIPACSFGLITEYNSGLSCLYIDKPDDDNLESGKLVFVPEAIPISGFGTGSLASLGIVVKSGTVVKGDKVGSKSGAWTAAKVTDNPDGTNDGRFIVLDVIDTSYLLIRNRGRDV